ncbi:cytochrome b/b6 domain-containing protein [Oscillatoria sp. FACHB-1406]|uniref:cytochrome b/b6 domain-containing protein n=1 Tax=Oscillatoria sp. FACHB-1406 TaxID=2692846 RepID=UPI001689D42E|nr:cytochrome b/b6 domain-containing protein [Oscillatoria sp. FACHB-1406]MBD2579389.1 cytochrome b/b6 domain-containing protein [Oscillatoria sp. FACHB-1406]
MSPARLYQPLLLRILHGLNAAIALLAIATSFWVYNTYDGRLIRLPLPKIGDIIGIHGTFGVAFFLLMPLFALYSFHLGAKRLIQPDTWGKLGQLNKPIGWYSWHRVVNTIMLLAATFAIATGRMMKEEWLPAGQLDSPWYRAHLWGWVILSVCLGIHMVMGLKVGGVALVRSMYSTEYRPEDSPRVWWQQIQDQWQRLRDK